MRHLSLYSVYFIEDLAVECYIYMPSWFFCMLRSTSGNTMRIMPNVIKIPFDSPSPRMMSATVKHMAL